MKKFIPHLLFAIGVSILSSCEPGVYLNSNEDTPKVAEKILEMPVQEALQYMKTQGFIFGVKADYADEYVFSKDEHLSEFSYDASIMLMFGAYNDTVKYVDAVHCMKTEESAYDLFWKWSHFAATVIKSKVSAWRGTLRVKEQTEKSRSASYFDGTQVEQGLAELDEQLKNGYITQTEYDERKATYMRDRNQFWADYKNAKGNINSVSEDYMNDESTKHPKEIHMYLDMNNGGRIELHYATHNFIIHWV